MSITKLPGSAIQSNTITTTQLTTTVVTQISAGGGPKVKSLIYPGNDTAANTVGGQTLYITGSGFAANAQVLVNGSAVPSQSFISASNISFTTPALSTGTYPVYVINPEDGGTAILYPGLLISGEPTWVTNATLSSVDASSSWSISLSATGDTPITYALAAGNTLPSGITLSANGLISGTLSSPPGSETTYNFSVIATDAQNQDSTKQFSITASVGDAYFANNVLLIHADGTNNGNNHTFLDSSNNNFTITRNGNATQGSFSPFSQTGWSAYFDGTGDYLSVGDQTAFEFGSGNYTVELWWYPTSSSDQNIIGKWDAGGSEWILQWRSAGYYRWASGGSVISDATTTLVLNRWNHVAITKSGTSLRIYTNGSQIGTTATENSISATSAALTIGAAQINSTPTYVPGYISNVRILKGTAQYTGSTYTVPTSALTAIANTSLLTCQSNRFIDNSTNAFTITRNGDVSIQAFSPFAPTAAYSTANVGGSAYFNGSSYLSIADNAALEFGSSNFTIEGWYYNSGNPSSGGGSIFGKRQDNQFGSVMLDMPYANLCPRLLVSIGASNVINDQSTIPFIPYQWNHFAVVRNATSVKLYVNGALGLSGTASGSINDNANNFTIGADADNGAGTIKACWLSDFRYVRGTALYTTNFTPPTTPLTNIANTALLCNFTNAQIFDQTAKNVIETVGDAKVSTAQYKYGTASIYLDGSGDWLKIPRSALFDFGTGDFTVETWVRFNTVGVDQAILAGDGTTGGYDILYRTGIGLVIGRYNTAFDNTFAWSPSINTWYHIAWCRSGTSLRAFVDGIQIGSTVTNSFAYNGGAVFNSIGTSDNGTNRVLNGYIDDLRITKGYARYTSNFTPPSSAFQDK